MLTYIVNVNYKLVLKVIFFIRFKRKSDHENKKIKDKTFTSDTNIRDYFNGTSLRLKNLFLLLFLFNDDILIILDCAVNKLISIIKNA